MGRIDLSAGERKPIHGKWGYKKHGKVVLVERKK
jgi:hypothetical protein